MKQLKLFILASFAAACTNTPTSAISEFSVPSFTAAYDQFSCDQLYSEGRRIASQMYEIADVKDADADMERLEFVGGVLYWPVLFLVDGSSDSKAAQEEYDQLKARLLSLSEWVITQKCSN